MSWQRTWRKRIRQARAYRHLDKPNTSLLASKGAFIGFILFIALVLFAGGLFAFYAKDLPQPDKIVRREGFATKIYDRNGELLYDVFAHHRRTTVYLSN